MDRYDKLGSDVIRPINFHDWNCCPNCGKASLVILDHEFDITSINSQGYIGEVLQANIETEIACPECGLKTKLFCLDSEGRIKICTEAEYIYEEDQKRIRLEERAAKIAREFIAGRDFMVGLKSKDDNPFGNWEITHF